MITLGLDGFLQNRADQFLNEYVRDEDNFLTPLTGFHGSTGLALVLPQRALLLVDGRYETQASEQCHSDWRVMGPTILAGQSYGAFMADAILASAPRNNSKKKKTTTVKTTKPRNLIIGFVADFFSHQQITHWQQQWQVHGITLRPLPMSFITAINPPAARTIAPIFDQPITYAGLGRAQKLQQLSEALRAKNADALLVVDNANLAWLLNLRAFAIPFNPVVPAFALLLYRGKKPTVHVFGDAFPDAMHSATTKNIDQHYLSLHPLNHLKKFLSQWQKQNPDKKIAIDDGQGSYRLVNLIKPSARLTCADPIDLLKAIKNSIEIKGAIVAHEKDGVALVKFFYWLEKNMVAGGRPSEQEIADKLWHYRQTDPDCICPSFETIPALSAHAALPHYQTNPHTNRPLTTSDILLLDSGAHYYQGTTDITRTLDLMHHGHGATPPPWYDDFCHHYTLVLQGHLALARARFPQGTTGAQLDPLARAPLWAQGLDYNHGTGHGVGSFLPVHEGPQYIGKGGSTAIVPGMITSNEPGYYRPDHYGIRLENLELCQVVAQNNAGEDILGFTALTLCPFDLAPLRHHGTSLLPSERDQLNAYHRRVYDSLAPHLPADEKNWLAEKTQPL